MANLRQEFVRAVGRAYYDSLLHGRLGRLNDDGTYTLKVEDRPSYAYVRMADGSETLQIARNPGIPLQGNLPVRMSTQNGDLVLEGVNFEALAEIESGTTSSPPAAGVQVHHHRIGSGLEYLYDARLWEAGSVAPASDFVVYIRPFRYQKADSSWEYWPGGYIDLASHQPGTAGEHAWVLVGIDPSDNTATAAAGTAKADTSELTIAELDDITFAGKIPCGAVRVREDDTDLSDLSKYVDAHGWHNQVLNQLRSLTGNLGVYVDDGGDVDIGGHLTLSLGNEMRMLNPDDTRNSRIKNTGATGDSNIEFMVGDGPAPTSKMALSKEGRLGVGELSPGAGFHLKGSGNDREIRIEADDDNPTLRFVDSLGNRWLNQMLGTSADEFRFLSPSNNTFIFKDDGYFQPTALGEAWKAPTFNTGWANAVGSGYGVGYRLFGDKVLFRGRAERTSGSDDTLFTLPSAYRPSAQVTLSIAINRGGTYTAGLLIVETTGVTRMGLGIASVYTNDDDLYLDGLSFSI